MRESEDGAVRTLNYSSKKKQQAIKGLIVMSVNY
jgi:hypothetical protein